MRISPTPSLPSKKRRPKNLEPLLRNELRNQALLESAIMKRREFIRKLVVTGAGAIGAKFLQPLHGMQFLQKPDDPSLMGHRFVTLCIMIRTTPWEVSRDVKLIKEDESKYHTLKVVRDLRKAFSRDYPDGRLTWGFTLNALEDKRPNYQDIRKYAVECHQKHGDEVSYFPWIFSGFVSATSAGQQRNE